MQQEAQKDKLPMFFISEENWLFWIPGRGSYSIPYELKSVIKSVKPKGFTLTQAVLKKLDDREYLIFKSVNEDEVKKSTFVSDKKIIDSFREFLN